MHDTNTDQALIETIDAHHARICRAERDLLRAIAEADRRELWRDTGARDLAHWLAMRHGISE